MYLPMRYPSEKEVKTLPHVYLTSSAEQWNSDSFGDEVGDDQWFDAIDDEDGALDDDDFFDSRDTFFIEPNFHCDINRIAAEHSDLTFDEARKVHAFECKMSPSRGKCKKIDFEKLRVRRLTLRSFVNTFFGNLLRLSRRPLGVLLSLWRLSGSIHLA